MRTTAEVVALLLAALGMCWLAATLSDPGDPCPWPSDDLRNPTGCVIYIEREGQ